MEESKRQSNVGEGGFTIYHNFVIKSDVKAVFEAISDPLHLVNWWPQNCSGERKMGGNYNFYFGQEYNWFGKVVSFNSEKNFHIKMTKSDADWEPTSFGFDLEDSNNIVHVSFWHKDWKMCNEHFKIASFCWAILLKGLKDYVEKGIVVPFDERN